MKVWIDQDLCTGDGLCEEIAPAVFTLLDDGLAYVKEEEDVKNDPGGSAGMAAVPGDLEDAVVEAATAGDDYEIAFTCRRRNSANVKAAAKRAGTGVTQIGTVKRGRGVAFFDAAGMPGRTLGLKP